MGSAAAAKQEEAEMSVGQDTLGAAESAQDEESAQCAQETGEAREAREARGAPAEGHREQKTAKTRWTVRTASSLIRWEEQQRSHPTQEKQHVRCESQKVKKVAGCPPSCQAQSWSRLRGLTPA